MTAYEFFERVTLFFEVTGVLVLFFGLFWSFIVSVISLRRQRGMPASVRAFRHAFGGTLLLSLEILIAADLTRTITIDPTLDSVLVLAVVVLIRTVLSISLDTEIDGVAPWRRLATESGATKVTRASRQAMLDD